MEEWKNGGMEKCLEFGFCDLNFPIYNLQFTIYNYQIIIKKNESFDYCPGAPFFFLVSGKVPGGLIPWDVVVGVVCVVVVVTDGAIGVTGTTRPVGGRLNGG